MNPSRTTWLAFAVLGIVDGVLLLELPVAGIGVAVLAIVGIAVRRPRGTALAGLLVGIGITWTGLLLNVKIRCEAFNAVPGQGCEAPGIDGWILAGVAILACGFLASVAVLIRARWLVRE